MKSPFVYAGWIALFAGGLVAAPALPKEEKDDLKKLGGAWTITSWEQAGQALDKDDLESAKWVVKGDKYTFELNGVAEEGTIKLDPAKKPAVIDLAITSGTDKGADQRGIYKIEKDAITFCFARPRGKDRPTDFKSTGENGFILITVKRTKDD